MVKYFISQNATKLKIFTNKKLFYTNYTSTFNEKMSLIILTKFYS